MGICIKKEYITEFWNWYWYLVSISAQILDNTWTMGYQELRESDTAHFKDIVWTNVVEEKGLKRKY